MNLRLDIQGLRAVAVLSVLIFHINSAWLPGGFVGVDMFFIISGFLISKGLIKQIDSNSFSYLQFIWNRVKRIVPAYFVMSLLCSFVAIVLFIPSDAEGFLYNLRRGLFFTSNQVFATATDYFGAKSFENPLLHTWSLSIEMQFYIFLPFVLMFLPKVVYKWILILGGLILLSYTQYQLRFEVNKQGMYFSTLARVCEFVIGIGINFLPNSQMISVKLKSIASIGAVAVVSLSLIFINENTSFPGLLALPVCAAIGFLIWVEHSQTNRFLSSRSLAFIGKISYSLYLWHWPVLAFYRYYKNSYNLSVLETLALLIPITLLSLGSFYFVEEFFRKTAKKRFYIGMGLLSIVLVCTWYFARKHFYEIQLFERVYTSSAGFNMDNHAQHKGYFLLGDSKKEDDQILLLGDSHGMVMNRFFDVVGQKNCFNFSTLTINYILPLEGYTDSLMQTVYKKQYYEALPISNDLIKKSKIIFILKNWHDYKNNDFNNVLNVLVKKLNPNQSLVLVSDFPELEKDPVRQYRSVLKTKEFRIQQINYPRMPIGLQEIIDNNKNIYYLDLKNIKFFKSAPYFNDTLMYYDKGHLNYYGSSHYGDFEGQKLADLVKQLQK